LNAKDGKEEERVGEGKYSRSRSRGNKARVESSIVTRHAGGGKGSLNNVMVHWPESEDNRVVDSCVYVVGCED
jgi:hypothetical protein